MKTYNFVLFFLIVLLIPVNLKAQGIDKVLFVKPVPVKLKSQSSYSVMVGYVATEDRLIALELSGGPNKYYANKNVQVKKGQSITEISLNPTEQPPVGKGYRLLLSIREKKGGWKTTKAATIINNLEFVDEDVRFSDNASFSPATPYSLENSNSYDFSIDCSFSTENIIQVSMWNDKNWLGSTKKISVPAGNSSEKINVAIKPPVEGKKYRLLLTFGTPEDFENKTTKSKEMTGVRVKKAAKKLTLKEINEKSIQISVNKESEILTLPGKSVYGFIKIIALNGQILLEKTQTNSIKISELNKGAYFAITNEGDYFKFVKF